MKYLIIPMFLLLGSCGKPRNEVKEKIIRITEKNSFSGTFFIGGQYIKMYNDEAGNVDVIGSYIYTKNKDGTDGEVYIYGSNQSIINGTIRWENKILKTQRATYLKDFKKDSGSNLSNVDHYLTIEITHENKLKVVLTLRDNKSKLISKRELLEE